MQEDGSRSHSPQARCDGPSCCVAAHQAASDRGGNKWTLELLPGSRVSLVLRDSLRLGVIRRIVEQDDNFRHNTYDIAPLGHMLLDQQDMSRQASAMRPFLSFSIPPTGDRVKDYLGDQTYDQVDWLQLTNMIHDHAIIGLESSKLAAKRVNASFSLFNKERTISPTQSTYGGVFLGAEQIRTSDAIRVARQGGTENTADIMYVKSIYSSSNGVNFIGNVYRLMQAPTLPDGTAAPHRPAASI